MKNPYLIVKRMLDFIFALILLIIASPIMIIAALAIKLESKGPILFQQKRPGKDTKIFVLKKFRTMNIENEIVGKKLSDMERITKVGNILRKTSIDELPQLFNILKGDMSFIGPRPLLIQYLEHYSEEQIRRHAVTPGISGWAQVNGRNTISWEERFKLDLWYVNNICFTVDCKIFFMTIAIIITGKGINNSKEVNMPLFTGKSACKNSVSIR